MGFLRFRTFHCPDGKNDELIIVTSAYFADVASHKAKRLNLYRKYITNRKSLETLELEVIPDVDAEPDEIPDPKNNTYRYWAMCRRSDLKYRNLIKAICNHDVGIRPMIYHRVYFINITRGTIFHIYDDRGCDVISEFKEDLMQVYETFDEWILAYDRERIDKVFLG